MIGFKVLVLEGGFNEEHQVSLQTGNQVKQSLLNLNIDYESIIVNPNTFEKEIKEYNSEYLCFNALHGTYGEDGEIQKVLEKNSLKFTHSNSKASEIGFNKELTKKKVHNTSILTLPHIAFEAQEINKDILLNAYSKMGSFLIKPIFSGSSYGIKIFKNEETINSFIKDLNNNLKIYENHSSVIIEKFVQGRELTVSVIERNNESIPIEVTEIKYKNDFFDYESKYTSGLAHHVLPADIPKIVYQQCMENAKLAHDKIDCKCVSRSDFIFDNDKVYFLEINTQPGLTKVSLVPEQLNYHNISFDDLILNLLKSSL